MESNIEERKPIWMALSEFYLDTELTAADLRIIASTFKKSEFSLEEIQEIDKNEVFPVLLSNLLSYTGEWISFDEDWLEQTIVKSLNNRNWFNQLTINLFYRVFRWMLRAYWQRIATEYSSSTR